MLFRSKVLSLPEGAELRTRLQSPPALLEQSLGAAANGAEAPKCVVTPGGGRTAQKASIASGAPGAESWRSCDCRLSAKVPKCVVTPGGGRTAHKASIASGAPGAESWRSFACRHSAKVLSPPPGAEVRRRLPSPPALLEQSPGAAAPVATSPTCYRIEQILATY